MQPTNVIVAGLARSGLTATCQMLDAGGMCVAGNYPGYEPFAMGCVPWGKINGQVVKLVDSHMHLPPSGTYAVIIPRRSWNEQAKSFNKFMKAIAGSSIKISNKQLIRSFKRDYRVISEWARSQHKTLTIEFEKIITAPSTVANKLGDFLGVDLDVSAASSVIIERSPTCHTDLLEIDMLERR